MGTFTRRTELQCSSSELENYASVVLMNGEVLFIRNTDNSIDVRMGDGQTSIGNLPDLCKYSDLARAEAAMQASESASLSAEQSKNTAIAAEAQAEIYKQQAQSALLNGVSTHNTSTDAHQDIRSAIGTVEAMALGASVSETFADIVEMVTTINAKDATAYRKGRNINIVTVGVPDLWVAYVDTSSAPYTYVSDTAFVQALETNGLVQVGYYKLAMLETQKIDLTDYASKLYVQAALPLKIKQSVYDAMAIAGTLDAGRIYYPVPDDKWVEVG